MIGFCSAVTDVNKGMKARGWMFTINNVTEGVCPRCVGWVETVRRDIEGIRAHLSRVLGDERGCFRVGEQYIEDEEARIANLQTVVTMYCNAINYDL